TRCSGKWAAPMPASLDQPHVRGAPSGWMDHAVSWTLLSLSNPEVGFNWLKVCTPRTDSGDRFALRDCLGLTRAHLGKHPSTHAGFPIPSVVAGLVPTPVSSAAPGRVAGRVRARLSGAAAIDSGAPLGP